MEISKPLNTLNALNNWNEKIIFVLKKFRCHVFDLVRCFSANWIFLDINAQAYESNLFPEEQSKPCKLVSDSRKSSNRKAQMKSRSKFESKCFDRTESINTMELHLMTTINLCKIIARKQIRYYFIKIQSFHSWASVNRILWGFWCYYDYGFWYQGRLLGASMSEVIPLKIVVSVVLSISI